MTIQDKTQKTFREGRGYTRKDWDAVDSPELTDDELVRMKPARYVPPPEFFEAVKKAAGECRLGTTEKEEASRDP